MFELTTGTSAFVLAVALTIDSLIQRRKLKELHERLESVERKLATAERSRSATPGAY